VLSQSLILREEEVLHKYQDRLEEADLEENTRLYERKGLLGDENAASDNSEDDQGRVTGKEFGIIDWGDEEDDEENVEEVKMPPLRVREESKVLAPLEEQEEYLR
jgi:hypothetical protein